jgi:hypothetical protein
LQNTISDQLAALTSLSARDNVHLTSAGYRDFVEGIFREAQNFGVLKTMGRHFLYGKQLAKTADWHGFFLGFSELAVHV